MEGKRGASGAIFILPGKLSTDWDGGGREGSGKEGTAFSSNSDNSISISGGSSSSPPLKGTLGLSAFPGKEAGGTFSFFPSFLSPFFLIPAQITTYPTYTILLYRYFFLVLEYTPLNTVTLACCSKTDVTALQRLIRAEYRTLRACLLSQAGAPSVNSAAWTSTPIKFQCSKKNIWKVVVLPLCQQQLLARYGA